MQGESELYKVMEVTMNALHDRDPYLSDQELIEQLIEENNQLSNALTAALKELSWTRFECFKLNSALREVPKFISLLETREQQRAL